LDELRRQVEHLTSRCESEVVARDAAMQARDAAMQARDAAEEARKAAEQARELAERQVERLKLENKRLAMRLYGRRSERLSPENLKQLVLALGGTEEEAAAADPLIPVPPISDAKPEDRAQPERKPKKRRTRTRKTVVSREVERRVTLVSVPVGERTCCHCGEEMTAFGVVEHERLEFVPGHFVVEVERREKLACKHKGCQGEAITAERREVPESPLRVGVSVLAELIESKCDDALPVHRQCDRFRRMGVDFPESTAYGYWRHATSLLIPLAEALLGQIMEDPNWVGIDDTGLDVIDSTRLKGKYRGHIWCFRAHSGLVAYQFTETWQAEEIAKWMALLGKNTHVQVDDYKGYGTTVEFGGRKMVVVPLERRLGCMMHVRRRFFAAFELGDKRAAKAIAWIKELYAVEARARGKPPEERLALRKEHSLGALEAFEKWCDEMQPRLGKTGPLAEAVSYALQQRVYVRRCFMDGRFEIDNGAVEREIREVAVGRKNYLFTGSADAGERLAAAYTLVQTCRNLGISTREYLNDVLRKLEAGWPARQLTDLLPHRWAALRASQA